jgi:hypothetical protein
MEVLKQELQNPLISRLIALKNLDSYIEESIYYRTHSKEFKYDKIAIWTYGSEGKSTKIL